MPVNTRYSTLGSKCSDRTESKSPRNNIRNRIQKQGSKRTKSNDLDVKRDTRSKIKNKKDPKKLNSPKISTSLSDNKTSSDLSDIETSNLRRSTRKSSKTSVKNLSSSINIKSLTHNTTDKQISKSKGTLNKKNLDNKILEFNSSSCSTTSSNSLKLLRSSNSSINKIKSTPNNCKKLITNLSLDSDQRTNKKDEKKDRQKIGSGSIQDTNEDDNKSKRAKRKSSTFPQSSTKSKSTKKLPPDKDDTVTENSYKPKLPIWNSTEKLNSSSSSVKGKRSSRRLSKIKGETIYEFITGTNQNGEDEMATKKVNRKYKRPQMLKRRKKYKGSLKTTLLTTDLTWQKPFISNLSVNSFYKKSATSREPATEEMGENLIIPSILDSHCSDVEIEDVGYDASVSVTHDFSMPSDFSSVNMAQVTTDSIPSIPKTTALVPTPKINAMFPGTTSTPSGTALKPAGVQDEMKICFGFDEPEAPHLGAFSPVHNQLATSHLSTLSSISYCVSDTGDIDPQPTRFALPLGYRRPFTQVQNTKSIRQHKSRQQKIKEKKSHQNTENSTQNSLLFEVIENNDNIHSLNSVENDHTTHSLKSNYKINSAENDDNMINLSLVLSPEKSFLKPPRKSYTRESLEEVKLKYHKALAGGYPTTDTDTENDEFEEHIAKRRKNLVRHPPKKSGKTYRRKKIKKTDESHKENQQTILTERPKQIKKKESQSDKSIEDWASDLNTHFSEVEETDLMVE